MCFRRDKDKFLPAKQLAKLVYRGRLKQKRVNKVCASGLRSVTLADQIIRSGDEEIIVAGGMESMSNAPYFIPNARWGLRMGDAQLRIP